MPTSHDGARALIDSARFASYGAPTHHVRARKTAGSYVCMERCASCGQAYTVRLFDIRTEGHIRRYWWCLECAFAAHGRGADIEPSPAWIERAALNQLPVKELMVESDPSRSAAERRQGRLDRRRWSIQPRLPDRRQSASIGRRTLDWRTGG